MMLSELFYILSTSSDSTKSLLFLRTSNAILKRRASLFITIMNPNVQNPPSAKEVKVLNRYTGFREPLSKGYPTLNP
jgi:hypothetical protein